MKITELLDSDLLQLFMHATFADLSFIAVVMAAAQGLPPEVLLDSGLREILTLFES